MNIEVIAEHRVDTSMLPREAKILDLGCRNFLFANEMKRRGYNVTCVDCDPLIYDAKNWFYNVAITNYNGWAKIERSLDPQATKINPRNDGAPHDAVPAMTLEAFSRMVHIDLWDFIKTDVEGSELQIISSLKKAPSKQIEIEFHRHTGAYGDGEINEMVLALESLGYITVSHEKTSQHGLPPNYWSSLFILRQ
jgi:FkbM family methyltransferase